MNTRRNWLILSAVTIISFIAINFITEYQNKKKIVDTPKVTFDLEQIKQKGILRVIMQYNSISYFIYRGQALGFEYELMSELAKQLGVKLEIVPAKTTQEQYNLLNEGKGDIIANGIYNSPKAKEMSSLTIPYREVEQVLVQRRPGRTFDAVDSIYKTDTLIHNISGLSNKIVYIAENSVFYSKLKELADTVGINLDVRILGDDRGTDDIIEAVAAGEIDYTIADKDLAMVNNSYFDNLNTELRVGDKQSLHWAVRSNSTQLLAYLNNWINTVHQENLYTALYDKYFKAIKNPMFAFSDDAVLQQGMISHYDALIQKYAKQMNWDWRLVAALINQESRFNPNARSWAGAQGLMQLMPGTAKDLGLMPGQSYNPDLNIRAGTSYLKKLENLWKNIPDLTQRIKFILASYNAGFGHVSDAVRLAEKNGYPGNKWDGSVEYFILYKSNPRFYNDAVVKYGYCRGQEPFNYVRRIMSKYFDYTARINSASAALPENFKLEQISPVQFDGVAGAYNPSVGTVSKSAKRELFLSHKLFDEQSSLMSKTGKGNLGKQPNELFVKRDVKQIDTVSDNELFQKKQQLFQQKGGGGLVPRENNDINKLKPRR